MAQASNQSGSELQFILGICLKEKKQSSKPMDVILSKIKEHFESDFRPLWNFKEVEGIKVPEVFQRPVRLVHINFTDEMLSKPVSEWPDCDALISFYSSGFPLDKAAQYVELARHRLCNVNELGPQRWLLDRRLVFDVLRACGVKTPPHLVISRDGLPSKPLNTSPSPPYRPPSLSLNGDFLEVNGSTIKKPFVEKPVDGENHNVFVYREGGGCTQIFRKIGDTSSRFVPDQGTVRDGGETGFDSFIYEQFVRTNWSLSDTPSRMTPSSSSSESSDSPDTSSTPSIPSGSSSSSSSESGHSVVSSKIQYDLKVYAVALQPSWGIDACYCGADPSDPGSLLIADDGELEFKSDNEFDAVNNKDFPETEKLSHSAPNCSPLSDLIGNDEEKDKKDLSCQGFTEAKSGVIHREETLNPSTGWMHGCGKMYVHGEARKSPSVDGHVERSPESGLEKRYIVALKQQERSMAWRVVRAFRQRVCGFDFLRPGGGGDSFICDVNGWSFVKGDHLYYRQCAQALGELFRDHARKTLRRFITGAFAEFHFLPPVPPTIDLRSILSSSMRSSSSADSSPDSSFYSVEGQEHSSNQDKDASHPSNFSHSSSGLFSSPSEWRPQLRGIIAVMRHSDRTPKQKVKIHTTHKDVIKYFTSAEKDVTMKSDRHRSQLSDLLSIVQHVLQEEVPQRLSQMDDPPATLNREFMSQFGFEGSSDQLVLVEHVLRHLYKGTKVQLKPLDTQVVAKESDPEAKTEVVVRCLLVCKWGGMITEAGKIQARRLGHTYRERVLAPDVCDWKDFVEVKPHQALSLSAGLVNPRGDEEERNVLSMKDFLTECYVASNNERRVHKTAVHFYKGLLKHPKLSDLTDKHKAIVHDDRTTQKLLGDISFAKDTIDEAKSQLFQLIHEPTMTHKIQRLLHHCRIPILEQMSACRERKDNPLRSILEDIYDYLQCVCHRLRLLLRSGRNVKNTTSLSSLASSPHAVPNASSRSSGASINLHNVAQDSKGAFLLYENETMPLMLQRWERLTNNFYRPDKGTFDTTKIPDVLDYIKYDSVHNRHILGDTLIIPLITKVKALSDYVVPHEYGLLPKQQLLIGGQTCHALLSQIENDTNQIIDLSSPSPSPSSCSCFEPVVEATLDSPARDEDDLDSSKGDSSSSVKFSAEDLKERSKTRLRFYFSSESHLVPLYNILMTAQKQPLESFEEGIVSEVNYLTQIIFKIYEDMSGTRTGDDRFCVQVFFTPGMVADPLASCDQDLHQLPVKPAVCLHSNLSLAEFRDLLSRPRKAFEEHLANPNPPPLSSSFSSSN